MIYLGPILVFSTINPKINLTKWTNDIIFFVLPNMFDCINKLALFETPCDPSVSNTTLNNGIVSPVVLLRNPNFSVVDANVQILVNMRWQTSCRLFTIYSIFLQKFSSCKEEGWHSFARSDNLFWSWIVCSKYNVDIKTEEFYSKTMIMMMRLRFWRQY